MKTFLEGRTMSCIDLKCAYSEQDNLSDKCIACREFTNYYHGYRLPCEDMLCQECFCRRLNMAVE